MKHIGWCLDRITDVLKNLPQVLTYKEDFGRARNLVADILKYSITLKELISKPKLEKILRRLEKESNPELRLEAHEVDKLLKDLLHFLDELYACIEEMNVLIEERPDKWIDNRDNLARIIYDHCCDMRGDLRREYAAVTHTEEELKETVSNKYHLSKFLG